MSRSSPDSSWRRADHARSGARSRCCRTTAATLLDHALATARACEFDQLLVAVGSKVRRSARGWTCPAPRSSRTFAAALDGARPGDDRARADARRPARRRARRPCACCSPPRGDAPIAVCRYDDGRGYPLAFGRELFDDLRALHRRQGGLADARPRTDDVEEVPVAGRVPLDVDSWADYEAVVAAAAGHGPTRRAIVAPAAAGADRSVEEKGATRLTGWQVGIALGVVVILVAAVIVITIVRLARRIARRPTTAVQAVDVRARRRRMRSAASRGSTTRACASCTPRAPCGRWRSANERARATGRVALIIGLVAALIVATLLVLLLSAVGSIEKSVNGLLEIAGKVAGNTANIPQLQATAPVLGADRRRGRRAGRLHERADRRVR